MTRILAYLRHQQERAIANENYPETWGGLATLFKDALCILTCRLLHRLLFPIWARFMWWSLAWKNPAMRRWRMRIRYERDGSVLTTTPPNMPNPPPSVKS